MVEDLLDHRRIFDARDPLDRATTRLAGQEVALEYPLQPLRPCHRHVARGRWFVGGLSLAPASSGRCHLLTPSVVRRKDPVVTGEVDARRRHQGGQPAYEYSYRLKTPYRDGTTDGVFEPLDLMA